MRLSEIYVLEASDITTKRVERVIINWAKDRGISGQAMNDLIELVADGVDAIMLGKEHPDKRISSDASHALDAGGDPVEVFPWSIMSVWQRDSGNYLGLDAEGELAMAIEPLFRKNAT